MRGADYVIKRLAFAVLTVFVAVTINFALFRLAPGSAVTNLARVPHATPEIRLALKRQFGLDKSKWQQYVIYLEQLPRGNLGISFANSQPVSSNLRTALINTLPMVLLGTIFAIVFGTLTGVLAAWRRGTFAEGATVTTALGFYSMPTHWLGLMLVILFAGILPTGGLSNEFLINPSFWVHVKDLAAHITLPSLTLGLVLYGEYTLIVRSAMLETLGEDYVLTARAKGLKPWAILRKHALRNAMLPIATLVALSLGYIVAGAILIETVFSWPGIGRAVYDAVLQRDYPMLQGAFLLLTISVVFCNLVADLLYFKLDPRITT
ncbi:MAG: peptide/nickel transport system permease protein [Gaiellaceae bacterium]|nr:peptide/nickel transport system permease protein [Gaiellaceae bacterium]